MISQGIVSLDILGDACDWIVDQCFQAINVLKDDSDTFPTILDKKGEKFVPPLPPN